MSENGAAYDYIIIGAGSAGCVLAARLSENPANKVLLLEEGGDNRNLLVRMPKGIGKIVANPRHSWHYQARPEPAEGDEGAASEVWVRGRGLGGTSAINGMIYVRGQPADFATWAREAGPEWGWDSMKAAFRAIEDHELGDDGVRGAGGAVTISSGKLRYPLAEIAIRTGEALGLERREDLNRDDQEGIGYFCHNIKNGRRQSASDAFLTPIRKRRNLDIVMHASVERIRFEGRRACGLDCRVNGEPRSYAVRGEIIVSAGAIQSPKLLLLSGIGPARQLRALGIEVVQDSPDVGRRMLEHMVFTTSYRIAGERGLNHRLHGAGLVRSVLEYFLLRRGPLATGLLEVGAFVRTNPTEPVPNVELLIGGATSAADTGSSDATGMVSMDRADRAPGLSIIGALNHLDGEGQIALASADPTAPPRITPVRLESENDRRQAIEMVRYIRKFTAQAPLADYIVEELTPGRAVETDEEILAAVRRAGIAGTHAFRTCRMGRDANAVVDERLCVRGVTGLRVADCSVMPGTISGSPHAAAMATGRRAADLILEDARKARGA